MDVRREHYDAGMQCLRHRARETDALLQRLKAAALARQRLELFDAQNKQQWRAAGCAMVGR